MQRILPKRFRSDLLEALLSLEDTKDIKREITFYWSSQVKLNESMRFSDEQKKAFMFMKRV